MIGEAIKAALPELALLLDPLLGSLKGIGIHTQEVLTAFDAALDQPGVF